MLNALSAFYKVVQQHNLGDVANTILHLCADTVLDSHSSERIIKIDPRFTKLCYKQKGCSFFDSQCSSWSIVGCFQPRIKQLSSDKLQMSYSFVGSINAILLLSTQAFAIRIIWQLAWCITMLVYMLVNSSTTDVVDVPLNASVVQNWMQSLILSAWNTCVLNTTAVCRQNFLVNINEHV